MEAVQALPLSGWFGRPSSNRWTLAGSEGTPAYPCDRGDPVAQLTRKGFGSTPIKDAEPQRLMARRTGSSRSQDAVSSLCSSGWSALRTFGDRMRSLDKRGLNDGPGPFQAPRCTPTDVSGSGFRTFSASARPSWPGRESGHRRPRTEPSASKPPADASPVLADATCGRTESADLRGIDMTGIGQAGNHVGHRPCTVFLPVGEPQPAPRDSSWMTASCRSCRFRTQIVSSVTPLAYPH